MRTIRLFGFILLFSIIFWGCPYNDDIGKEDTFSSQIDTFLDTSKETSNKANVTEGAIYLDASISMQGYISTPTYNRIPFTLLQHMLHNVLQTTFHHVGISKPVFKTFGATIMNPEAPMANYAVTVGSISPRSRFNCSETNIVGVFHEVSKKESSLSVILTDGSQDVHSVNGGLAAGFDRPEFIQAISNGLIERGFGVWLIGIMNDFDGFYYNIIPDRNGEINNPRYFRGKRPVYCWVVSKNVKQGREFVQYLYNDITRLSRTNLEDRNGSVVQAIELAPGIYPEITLIEPRPNNYFKFNNEISNTLTFVLDWRDSSKHKLFKISRIDFPTTPGNNVLFVLQARLELKLQYKWNSFPSTMWQVETGDKNSLIKAIPKTPDINTLDSENLRFVFINFPYDRLIVLNPRERSFELPVCLHADLETGLDNSWIKTWSTVIDTEERHIQGKTLYLYDVISDLLKLTIGKKRIGTCLRLVLVNRK